MAAGNLFICYIYILARIAPEGFARTDEVNPRYRVIGL
jgi:hypothetical protein